MNQAANIKQTAYASLMAALITVGAYISIPIGPVPIVLQNFFVFLAGVVLGPLWGLSAVGLYLLAGAIGLPVFAGGVGGFSKFFGPTGGYLIGYLPAVYIIGNVSRKFGNKMAFLIAGVLVGAGVVYLCGVPWLKAVTGLSWNKALAAGCFPFIPGDLIKVVAAAFTGRSLFPVIRREDQVSDETGH